MRFQGPPRLLWLISALLVGLFWSLAALRHTLLQSNGFDLDIYDQVAWQMSQGLEPRSTLFGLHHMGDYGAWVFYTIGSLCRLVPTVHWLFFHASAEASSHSLAPAASGDAGSLKARERWPKAEIQEGKVRALREALLFIKA